MSKVIELDYETIKAVADDVEFRMQNAERAILDHFHSEGYVVQRFDALVAKRDRLLKRLVRLRFHLNKTKPGEFRHQEFVDKIVDGMEEAV